MRRRIILYSHLLVVLVLLTPTLVYPAEPPEMPEPLWQQPCMGGKSSSNLDYRSTSIRINEVLFYPEPGEYEWVELKNEGTAAVDISGYRLTDEDGNWYEFPELMPEVPAGALVVVVFDGLGDDFNDLSFDDNVATLHGSDGLVNILQDDADQIALYVKEHRTFLPLVQSANPNLSSTEPRLWVASSTPEPNVLLTPIHVVSFVAWGANPGQDAYNASSAGIWSEDWYVGLSRGHGRVSSESMLSAGESIGLLQDSPSAYPNDWALFLSSQVTRGKDNGVPVIHWFYPDSGMTMDGTTFAISWNAVHGAQAYHFQMDDSSDSGSPMVDVLLSDPSYVPTSTIPSGTYYWRVKVVLPSGSSPWSPTSQINSLVLGDATGDPYRPDVASPRITVQETLDITWQLQHKDTWMLDLDGSPETGQARWDSAHEDDGDLVIGNGRPVRANLLDDWYCVRASISMLASYYGGKLSQDRISYQMFKGGKPEGDLGHGDGPVLVDGYVDWALGTDAEWKLGKPTFQQIRDWINARRPIVSSTWTHTSLINGYRVDSAGRQQLHFLDPWDRPKWVLYSNAKIVEVSVGPAGPDGAPNVRSDEDADRDGIPDTLDDSDDDEICDFDERNRFDTQHTDRDSDDDLVLDKQDVIGYLFDIDGRYSRKSPDVDWDLDRKEVDPDNDRFWNNGSRDGCEDANRNGKYEPVLGETSNFDFSQERQCAPPSCAGQVVTIEVDQDGYDFDKDGVYDFAYVSEDFMGNPGPFLATEGGTYCDGRVGSGNRISSLEQFGIKDYCLVGTAVNFVPGSENVGSYCTYTGGGPGDLFIVRTHNGKLYYKIELTEMGAGMIRFKWAPVNIPKCETCVPGQEGMDICF